MFKKILIHTRRTIKLVVLFMISVFLIVGAVAFLYKPTYSVSINGEHVGYTENKAELQRRINDYIEKRRRRQWEYSICTGRKPTRV